MNDAFLRLGVCTCEAAWIGIDHALDCNALKPRPSHCQCDACRDGVIHASDCAVHRMPAEPNGPCNCDAGYAQIIRDSVERL